VKYLHYGSALALWYALFVVYVPSAIHHRHISSSSSRFVDTTCMAVQSANKLVQLVSRRYMEDPFIVLHSFLHCDVFCYLFAKWQRCQVLGCHAIDTFVVLEQGGVIFLIVE
jgi:hypothetical protein